MAQSTGRKRVLSSSSFGDECDLRELISRLSNSPPANLSSCYQRFQNLLENLSHDEFKFTQTIDTILTTAYTADRRLQNLIAELLFTLSKMEVVSKNGARLSVYHLVSRTCQTMPDMSDSSLKEFLSALPFLNDLQRLNMLSGRPFFLFANGLMKHQGALPKLAIVCLYEILRVVDRLIDDQLYRMCNNEIATWKDCSGRVGRLCQQNQLDEPKCKEVLDFLASIKQKGGWERAVTRQTEPPKRNMVPQSTLRHNKPNVTSKIADQGDKRPAFQALLRTLRHTLSRLVGSPQNVDWVAREIRRSLASCNEAKFRDTIFALLTIASEATPMEQPVFIQILKILQTTGIDKSLNGKGLKIRTFISGWVMQLRHFDKMDEVVKFCKLLPVVNLLFRERLTISGVFKYYASEVANNEDEVSMLALYEILRNVDMLAEAKVWKYKQEEAAFYEECCCSLAMTCETNTIKDPNKRLEITQFLSAIPQKGGWHRASIARYLKNKAPQPSTKGPADTTQMPDRQIDGDSETDGEDDDSVILLASSFPNNNEDLAVDEGFIEEKPNVPPEQATESTPVQRNDNADLEEKVEHILKSLAGNPENWPNSASEIETHLRSLSTKDALNSSAKLIWKEISNAAPEVLPVYVHLADALQSVSVTTKKGRSYSLRKAFVTYAKGLRKCKKIEHLAKFCADLRVAAELFQHGLIESNIFRHFALVVDAVANCKSLKALFTYEILRCIDQLIDQRAWKADSDTDRDFWANLFHGLKKACRKYLNGHDRGEEILTFLEEVENKGGLFRKVKSKKNKPQLQEAIPEVTHANFCAFLETNFLKGNDGIMITVRFFKSFLLSLAAPCLFVEAVESILNRLFELNEDRNTGELAVKLCAELCQVNNEGGKSFITILQEFCVKFFSQKNRQETDESVLKFLQEVECAGSHQEQLILGEKLELLEASVKKKYEGCARLIARLFTEKMVPFNFFLSFVDCLLSIRTDDMIEALLEVLSIAGKEFEHEARVANCMEMWWINFFNELAQIGQQFDSSPRKKSIISEILLLKTNDWPKWSHEQVAAKRLRFMLLELTPSLTRHSSKYSAAVNRVRSFVNVCPSEYGRTLMDVMLSEFQNVLADLAQTQLIVQQQQQQIQQPIMMSYQTYGANNSPWLLPMTAVYNNESPGVKMQPSTGGGGGSDGSAPSTSAARVVSITSLPYNPT